MAWRWWSFPTIARPIVTHMVWYKVGSADEPPGKSGIAHFFEHLMFKGTTNHKAGEFDAEGQRDRWKRERLHHLRLYRLSPDRAASGARNHDGLRGRPHAQSDPDRRGHRSGARRHPRGAPLAHREQPGRAAQRGGRRDALPEPTVPNSGHRLDARDRTTEPRRCDRLLQPVLRAQQCDPGRGRRCRAGDGQGARRKDLWQGAARPRPAAARPAEGAEAEHQAHCRTARRTRHRSELFKSLGCAILSDGERR